MTRENGAQWRLRAYSGGAVGGKEEAPPSRQGWGGSGWAAGDDCASAGPWCAALPIKCALTSGRISVFQRGPMRR